MGTTGNLILDAHQELIAEIKLMKAEQVKTNVLLTAIAAKTEAP